MPDASRVGATTASANVHTGADLLRRRFERALTAALTAGHRPTAGDHLGSRAFEIVTRIADEHPEADHRLIIDAYNIFRTENP
ncbi:hypothetical protein [Rhodococcus sp. LB1]|uniref:hypothetical protein n=1 Tax=Rhodococcus sp. LB1 TaxID=1807499 RepID=UPI000AE11BE7|nr:hypothetical protein [Rhodococcus sp. LB1]